MARSRQRLASFEARSVQLIAACTLGLAGIASMPTNASSRLSGQASSPAHSSAPSSSHGSPDAPRQLVRRSGS